MGGSSGDEQLKVLLRAAGTTASLLAALMLLGAGQGGSTAPAPDPPEKRYHDEKVGLSILPLEEGIWRHVTTMVMESGRPVPANGLIVTSGGEALLIDTGWTSAQTGAILDWIENDLRHETIGVVVTHFHPDCMGGIDLAIERGLETWGSSLTARLARERGLGAPRSTFDDHLTVAVGGRVVELYYPGAGHAPDNIVAWIPERRLLFAGCLVKSARAADLGFRGDADMAAWPGSVTAVRARFPDAHLIVPGHGEPGSSAMYDNTLRLLLEARP